MRCRCARVDIEEAVMGRLSERLDRKARERAVERLALSPGESVLEYEVAPNIFTVLPKPFPFPIPASVKRLDLVATDRALYVHASRTAHVARWPWSHWLSFSTSV